MNFTTYGPGDPQTWGGATPFPENVIEDMTSLQPFGDGGAMVSFEINDGQVVLTGASCGDVALDEYDIHPRVWARWLAAIEAEQADDARIRGWEADDSDE